jgi:hypothetical protein
MHVATTRSSRQKRVPEVQPPPIEAMVLAICPSFQCLAYLDEYGIWRRFFGKREIEGRVLDWKSI